MKSLKIGITGVRGIVGETLSPELVIAFAQAFATYLDGGHILICRDTRPSGPMMHASVLAGLLASGCCVTDLGICPTPTMQLAVAQLGASGGISITAGHNPSNWNALKFVRADGLYLSERQAEELLDIYHQGEFIKAEWRDVQPRVATHDAIPAHIERLKSAFDVEAIRRRALVVAVDCCNGACSFLSPRWLEELGCRVLALNDDPTAAFPHNPEPRRETMAQLRAVVRAGHADIGLAHDADGERLGLVTETGEPLSEELTLALAAHIKLQAVPGVIVTNISTTAALEEIAARQGGSVTRTPVGAAYISEAMGKQNAVLGGEGSGAVAVPEVHRTSDSAACAGLILEHLARTGAMLSSLVAELPRYVMVKRAVPVAPHLLFSVLNRIRAELEDARPDTVDLRDGIKLSWPDRWLHIRASNTESMIRVIAEARDEDQARELANWALDRLS